MGWLRDRPLRLALEVSLLVHLLLMLLPQPGAAPRPVPAVALEESREEKPLRFELVELPQQREEVPSRTDAPVSDMSRRAHGGQGEKADKPGVAGTNPHLRLAPAEAGTSAHQGAGANPPSLLGPAEEGPQKPQGHRQGDAVVKPEPTPETAPAVAAPALRGLTPFSTPRLGVQPDRRGGQVDLGALSFDTQWYDWGPYAAEMLRRIRYHWRIPELAQLGVPGVVRIRFFIEKDGRVTGLTILKDSSHPPMDFAARDAILNASPLPPLPAEVGVEREGVIITFYYNVRPPEDS